MAKTENDLSWSEKKEEVHSSRPIKFLVWLIHFLPSPVMVIIVFLVSAFYFLFSKRARSDSRLYQKTLISYLDSRGIPVSERNIKRVSAYKQIFSFSLCVVEKIQGWSGKTNLDIVDFHEDSVVELKNQLANGKGAYLITAHLGNIDLFRSLALSGQTGVNRKIPIMAIMETNVTAEFNKTMQELNPDVSLNIIPASQIGIETIGTLEDVISQGGLVVIAADRTSINSPERNVVSSFLGQNAEFPYGAFLLPMLLNAPVYYMFATRKRVLMWHSKYNMFVEASSVKTDACPRTERENRIKEMCAEYVKVLEKYCFLYPFQWYNFFNFWKRT